MIFLRLEGFICLFIRFETVTICRKASCVLCSLCCKQRQRRKLQITFLSCDDDDEIPISTVHGCPCCCGGGDDDGGNAAIWNGHGTSPFDFFCSSRHPFPFLCFLPTSWLLASFHLLLVYLHPVKQQALEISNWASQESIPHDVAAVLLFAFRIQFSMAYKQDCLNGTLWNERALHHITSYQSHQITSKQTTKQSS